MAESKSDPWRTEFGVQPFLLDKRKLKAGEARPAGGRDQAIRLGERLALTSAGVLVYACRAAPDLGEYDPPTILATHGSIPDEVIEQLAG